MKSVIALALGLLPVLAAGLAHADTIYSNECNLGGPASYEHRDYACSGQYDRELAEVIKSAEVYIKKNAKKHRHPALVLDIDETSLSNLTQILADGSPSSKSDAPCTLPAGPCGYATWQMLGVDPPIEPMPQLVRDAHARGVTVFFITGRAEAGNTWRIATEKNLKLFYSYKCLLLQPAFDGTKWDSVADWSCLGVTPPSTNPFPKGDVATFKAAMRDVISRKYTIIANIGDHCSDLMVDFDPKAPCPADPKKGQFKLPDPFY